MIPNNEFTNDPMLQPSMDVMYHNYQKYYTEKTCVKCGFKWWQKKADNILLDLCYKCRDEQLEQMNEGKL